MEILGYLGYIGDVASVVAGILAARKIGLNSFWQFLSGLSTSFFGGIIIRDWGLLHEKIPAIFSSKLEIAVTVMVGIITISVLKRCNGNNRLPVFFRGLLCAGDSLGVVGFAAFGYLRGIGAGATLPVALACAFATACGGGIIATIIRAVAAKDLRHLTKTLSANRYYYIMCAVVSLLCGALHSPDSRELIGLCIIVIPAGFVVEFTKK